VHLFGSPTLPCECSQKRERVQPDFAGSMETDMNNPGLVYSIPQACARAQTGRTALYQAINSGSLVARKRGKRTLILEDDLCRWLLSLPRIEASAAQSQADGEKSHD